MRIGFSLRYLLALVPGILSVLGNSVSIHFAYANLIWCFGVMVIADWILPQRRKDPPEFTHTLMPNFILYSSSLLHLASVISLIIAITHLKEFNSDFFILAISTGANSGIAGFISAHELIHRRSSIDRALGQVNLLTGNYMHFFIEHIHGHHKMVGTMHDPATARKGESIYDYLIRTIPAQWWNALMIEARRIENQKKDHPYGLSNYVVQTTLLEIVVLFSLGVILGPIVLLAYVLQFIVAIILLEYVNYIEHYGLVRNENSKVLATHSWRTDSPASRMSLLELSRHGDHHSKASKSYHTLRSMSESPELPFGYFGMFYFALVPKIWFRMVDSRIPKEYHTVQ